MEDIIIHREGKRLKLTFIEAFHPSKLNIKADHWYFKYELTLLDDSYKFEGWFTGNFWLLDRERILVLEEYAIDNFDSNSIEYDDDIELKLFLIDFKRNASARFSRIRKGHFKILELTDDMRLIYQKKQFDRIGEFEVSLDSLEFNQIDI